MAETNGLLNRRTGKSGTEGSNPSVSATLRHWQKKFAIRCRKNEKALRVFRPLRPLTRSVLGAQACRDEQCRRFAFNIRSMPADFRAD